MAELGSSESEVLGSEANLEIGSDTHLDRDSIIFLHLIKQLLGPCCGSTKLINYNLISANRKENAFFTFKAILGRYFGHTITRFIDTAFRTSISVSHYYVFDFIQAAQDFARNGFR